MVVDFAAAEEEVRIGVEAADGVLNFGAEEEVLLAADFAFVDGIGAAGFERRTEEVEGAEGEVGSSGDAEVFTA